MQRRETAFAAGVAVVHLAIATFAILHHEMWRDELHSWLVARDASNPWAVIRGHAYDGHPPLWYEVLWIVTRFTSRVTAMQALHVGIAALDVFLFARFAPFPRWMRAVFAFGYFILYEYAAISRGYGMALLFVLLLCIRHKKRLEQPAITALLLAGLTLSTTVATLVGAAYTLILLLDARKDRRALLPVAAGVLAFLFAAWCAYPPADSTVAKVGDTPTLGWQYAPTRLIVAAVPIPRVDFFYWNSSLLLSWPPFWKIAAPVALLLFLWLAWVLRRHAILFVSGALALMCLFGLVYSGDVRHHGFLFVLFLMAAWIARLEGGEPRALLPTVAAILCLHVPASAVALYHDHKYVFSSGKRAADALRARGLERAPLVAEMDYPAIAVIGHLGEGAFAYSPRNGKRFSYVRWTGDRIRDPLDTETVAFARGLGTERGMDAVLVMNRPLDGKLVDGVSVVRLEELYDSMIEEENFYLYRVARN
jgi:hypothetical protein